MQTGKVHKIFMKNMTYKKAHTITTTISNMQCSDAAFSINIPTRPNKRDSVWQKQSSSEKKMHIV